MSAERIAPQRQWRARLRRVGKQRVAECATCGLRATCDEQGHPGGWPFWGGANPNIECCSDECMATWKRTHANVVEFANAQYLALLGAK